MSILPLIATSYALGFMMNSMMNMYHRVVEEGKRGDYSSLAELHALSSGMKALSTWLALDGTEAARRVVGGHGYSQLSGLPYLLQNYAQNVTWEGDNPIVCLQTARFLIKSLLAVQMGKGGSLAPSVAYLSQVQQELAPTNRCRVERANEWRGVGSLLDALRNAATYKAVSAAQALVKSGGGQIKFEGEPWNRHMVALVEAAKCHSRLIITSTFWEVIQKAEADAGGGSGIGNDPNSSGNSSSMASSSSAAAGGVGNLANSTLDVLQKLCALFSIVMVESTLPVLLESGYLSGKQAKMLREECAELVHELRPEAVALVDAFDYDDYVLNYSAIGRYDGNVYQHLLDMAKRTPLNKTEVGPGWEPVLQEFLAPQAKL
jgi:acyl-CoA oxidase